MSGGLGGGGFGGGGGFQNNIDNNFVGNNPGTDGEVMCNCGTPAKSLTVKKAGPNQGRQFYGCTKPMNEGCGFFQWADEAADGAGGGGGGFNQGSGGGRGRGRGAKRGAGGADTGVKKKRKCGLCEEEGHTRKTCPHS